MMSSVFVVLAACAFSQIAARASADPLADAVVEWVVSKGGFFSDKIEIRNMDLKDSNSPLGVFAVEDIDPKESLFEVPHSCYIALWDDAVEVDDNDETIKYYWENVCRLSRKLAGEMKLGKDSNYAPYIDYVQGQKRGQLPATWSKAGKAALRSIITPGSDVVDWIDRHLKGSCFEVDDEFQEHVVATTVQRGYDTTLIPIWDMFNHWNGRVNTENGSIFEGDKLQVRSSVAIKRGEEIFASYDDCADCGDTAWGWGTPEILRDFGFVERYCQRWVYPEQKIWFELCPKDMDFHSDSPEITLYWDDDEWESSDDNDGESWGAPGASGIAFLRRELQRLNEASTELKERGSIPEHEWDTIQQYYKSATFAVSKAIDSALLSRGDDEL